jgi:hypothetical protein
MKKMKKQHTRSSKKNVSYKNKSMKNIKILAALTLCLLLLFTSCGSDDSNDNNDGDPSNFEELIIGTWVYTSSTFNGESTELTECDFFSTLLFNSSQLITTEIYGASCDMSDIVTEDYSISGNMLSLTYQGDSYIAEISTLNTTTLSIMETEDSDVYVDTYTRQ